jgi:hypothetical protein
MSVLQTREAAFVSVVAVLWVLRFVLIFLVSPQHNCLELPAKFAGKEGSGRTVLFLRPQRLLLLQAMMFRDFVIVSETMTRLVILVSIIVREDAVMGCSMPAVLHRYRIR